MTDPADRPGTPRAHAGVSVAGRGSAGRAAAGGGGAGSAPVSDLPAHLDPRGPRSSSGRPSKSNGSRALLPPARPRRRAARILSWTAVVMSVLLFATAVLGYVLFRRYDGNIARIPGLMQALPGLTQPAAAPRGARNVLLVGSDTRDTTGSQFQGKGAQFTSGQRSDTVILAHLFGNSDKAQLISIPRDSYVSIPAYTDAKTGKVFPQHSAKINSAIEEGGPALLKATVEELSGIRVDNYVQIDFAGFQTMVEKLGGVEVCLKNNAKESNSGIDLKAGRQTIQGAQALAFVRQRYGLPNGDIDRIKRQQAFIGSITRKVLSSGTLLNPLKLNGFLDAATSSVAVDESLQGGGLTQLALRLRSFNAGGVAFATLPFSTISGRRDGQDVVLLDAAKMAVLFDGLKQDRAPDAPGPASPAAPLTVAPAGVRVSVLNGSGTPGLGRTAAQELARAGFVVVGSPGNRDSGTTGTVVRYGPTRAEAARTLAAAVPGATVEADPTLTGTVEIVVGTSFAGLVPVSLDGTPAPVAATAAVPTGAPAPTAANDGCVD